MPRLLWVCAAFLLLIPAGCGPDVVESLDLGVQIQPIPTPADTLSGEPFLISTPEGIAMSWVDRLPDGHALRMATLDGGTWSEPKTISSGSNWFVNWADVPTIMQSGSSTWAHWLEYNGDGRYSYGIRISESTDGGATWSEPEWLHEDRSATEHGFVAMASVGNDMHAVWLDGRQWAEGREEMTVRTRKLGHPGNGEHAAEPGRERLLDSRTCDCCPNAVVALQDRGLIAAYRNRSPEEVRDIYVVRMLDGTWEEPRPVHEDGWAIAACPVNGPALASRGERVAIAWFTAPEDVAEVRVAFSDDVGASFDAPITVSDGRPLGRVDVVLLEDGSAVVSWIEAGGGPGGQTEEGLAGVMIRRVASDGRMSQATAVVPTSSARASGYPRMVREGEDLIVAWTQTSPERRVRSARVDLQL